MGVKEVLKEQLEQIKPTSAEVFDLSKKTKELVSELKSRLKKAKISAQIFVGGSMAKNTLIRKKKYDIDVFIRFPKSFSEDDLAKALKKVVPTGSKVIHGSRDYYSLKKDGVEFELIPTLKISKPDEARNTTDLSYFHVAYVSKKLNQKIADEIRLTKAFTYYQDCYGAESYIQGFSGYSLELLIIYYGSFLDFLRAMAKAKPKMIIDPRKFYKGREALIQLNEAKLHSPIILVDPTFRERNALAALSPKTFERFQKVCKRFLANPSKKFFQLEDIAEKMRKKYANKLSVIELRTKKQAGDIAGTKLRKFHWWLEREMRKLFIIKEHHFVYDEEANIGRAYIVAAPLKEIKIWGPPVKMKKALGAFKKAHKGVKTSKGRSYVVEKSRTDLKKFITGLKTGKKGVMVEMGVSGIKLVG